MSFFEGFFREEKRQKSVVLIDIGADGVAGAYVRYEEDKLPTFLYSRRLPIEIQHDETHDRAMLRALKTLGDDLIAEGTPILVRVVGKGNVDSILVSVDAPWQETKVRIEHFESKEPFLFTKNLVTKKLEEADGASSEKMLVDETIIGTILNGYETSNPYGNKVNNASIIVLTSFIEQAIAHDIIATLEDLYHTKNIVPITGGSLRYKAMQAAFPHERDALILDATAASLVSVTLIRKGVLVSLVQVETPLDPSAWVSVVTKELTEVASHYPLPRTIFLLAREPEILSLRERLDTADFGSLWLSDNPPKIVSILRSNMSGMVQQTTTNPTDIVLLLMSLYFQNRHQTEGGW